MILREQLQSEIAELNAEVNRRLAAVKGIFAEVAGLRAEADLLDRILELRNRNEPQPDLLSVLILGFVGTDQDEPDAFCAATWSGSLEMPAHTRILLKVGWRSQLPDPTLPYFLALSNEWREQIQTRPAALLSMLKELSVGPIRTMTETTIRSEKVMEYIKEWLGDSEPLPTLSMVKG